MTVLYLATYRTYVPAAV